MAAARASIGQRLSRRGRQHEGRAHDRAWVQHAQRRGRTGDPGSSQECLERSKPAEAARDEGKPRSGREPHGVG
eukprot:7316757-Alexandrium_andersonii.AAC.1